ncbi:MAG TPA: DUF3040 domain-containing protein [Actinomycetales bacterium]|nr:DUF3040 domain-containing protein [Actinomycetales bacterium]
MPLSEHEQRLLEQMEQAMYAEDPKFASTMRGRTARARQRHKLLIGVIGVVVGLVLVVVGVAGSIVALAVAGFVVMLAGAAWAAAPDRSGAVIAAVGSDGRPQPRRGRRGKSRAERRQGASHESFMSRLEHRWDRRRDGGWGA